MYNHALVWMCAHPRLLPPLCMFIAWWCVTMLLLSLLMSGVPLHQGHNGAIRPGWWWCDPQAAWPRHRSRTAFLKAHYSLLNDHADDPNPAAGHPWAACLKTMFHFRHQVSFLECKLVFFFPIYLRREMGFGLIPGASHQMTFPGISLSFVSFIWSKVIITVSLRCLMAVCFFSWHLW